MRAKIKSLDASNNEHHSRIQKEMASARRKIFGLNAVLFFYFLFLIYFISLYLKDHPEPASSVLFSFIPMALIAAFIHGRFDGSIAEMLWVRIDRFLKPNVIVDEGGRNAVFGRWFGGLLILLTFWLGWLMTDMSFASLFSGEGLAGAQRIFSALLTPRLDILGVVLKEMVETVFIGFMATALSIPVAFIASFFCAKNLVKGHGFGEMLYVFFRFVFNFTRSVEPLIWAIVFSVWVGIGPFAGMLALMLHSVASLVKLYSEQIESIDRGPMEAIEATGANRIQVIWYAVVPQIVLPYLAFTIYRWDINIRMATIIGLVGGGGIGTLLMQYQGLARWNEVGTIVIVIAIVVWLMDWLSAKLREAIY